MKNEKTTVGGLGHSVLLRTFAQIRQSRYSYACGTLSEMPKPAKLKIRRNQNYA